MVVEAVGVRGLGVHLDLAQAAEAADGGEGLLGLGLGLGEGGAVGGHRDGEDEKLGRKGIR